MIRNDIFQSYKYSGYALNIYSEIHSMIQFVVVIIRINEGYALPKVVNVIGPSSSFRVNTPSADFSDPDIHYMVYWNDNVTDRGMFAGVVYQVERQSTFPIAMSNSETERARLGLLMRR